MSSGDSPGPAELTFPGDGEMALRMRAYPWATSPLGDPRDWPASLRTACRICLTSRFPMIVWWGEELRFLYNDAYLPLLGSKHPALGRPGDQVWSEIWATIGPMLDSVLHTGQATWSEDLLLPMNRHGYWEETYWTYSYSPLHDDDGSVRGVFTAVRDTTEQVVGRRRLAALQDLGAQAGQARSVAEACDLVVRALDRAREVVPFAAIYLRGPDRGSAALTRSTWLGIDPSPLPGGPGGWPVDEVLRSGHPVTLTDVIARFGELPAGGWQTPPSEAMVLPLKALRADLRTADVPVLLLSARAGQEAAIEGLEAGADDYLVKPFSAAELLARVRANVELARVRSHHARWRAALLDSLYEAFFLCDETGAVVEVNAAFADILGFGTDGLPYPPAWPWWPAETTDPEAHRLVGEVFGQLMTDGKGSFAVPFTCRDGRRIWVAGSFSEVSDPDNGRRMVVGTFRDITAEHYAVQREAALAAMGLVLSRAGSAVQVLRETLGELRRLWRARNVTAATWTGTDQVTVASTGSADTWEALPAQLRGALAALRDQPLLTPAAGEPGGAGIRLEHPAGTLAIWIELDPGRVLSAEDRTLLSLVGGYLGQALHRAYQMDQQRETALALHRAILGPSRLPAGFAVRYEPATRPLEVGGDWYDIVELPDGRIGIMVGDCVGHDLSAATVMGQLRSACRALLPQDASASQALTAMDRFASFVPGAECATVFCGILDPGSGQLTYSSAAHPPGIVVHPDGRIVLLEGGRSLPLAIRQDAGRTEAAYVLPPRLTLLLYTDGLVERRGRPLTDGIAAAGTTIHGASGASLEDLAAQIMTSLAPAGGYEDDVAIVLYHHPAPLDVTFAAESGQLALVRARLRSWLRSCDVGAKTAQDVLVAAAKPAPTRSSTAIVTHPASKSGCGRSRPPISCA